MSVFYEILLCFFVCTNTKDLFNTIEGPDIIPAIHDLSLFP